MNKAELVEEVANQTGLTKKTSREAVGAMTSAITDALARTGSNLRRGRTILTSTPSKFQHLQQ